MSGNKLPNTPAARIAAYVKLRDARDAAKKAFTESQKPLLAAMAKLENQLLQDLLSAGANSLASDAGTVYRNTDLSATVENRAEFLDHVRTHDLWDALDVKANKSFVREHLEESGAPIPGIKVTQTATVGVRRS